MNGQAMPRLSMGRRDREEAEAQQYAELIRDGESHDWPAINRAIIDRYSLTALQRIKQRAWRIIAVDSMSR